MSHKTKLCHIFFNIFWTLKRKWGVGAAGELRMVPVVIWRCLRAKTRQTWVNHTKFGLVPLKDGGGGGQGPTPDTQTPHGYK